MRVRGALIEQKDIVDAQVNAAKKTVTVMLREDELDEAKITKLLDKKGFEVVSLKKLKSVRL